MQISRNYIPYYSDLLMQLQNGKHNLINNINIKVYCSMRARTILQCTDYVTSLSLECVFCCSSQHHSLIRERGVHSPALSISVAMND